MQKLTASALKEPNIIDKGPDEKDVAKFKEGELADFRKTVKKIDTGYQTRSYING
jgi:zinc protease